MLPLHTSHTLQLLNINYFKPFKIAFHVYKDVWTLVNKRKGARKEDLAQWVSLAFKKAFMPPNICKDFETTSIRPLNPQVMTSKMHLLESF
jgi:hypothetical protein